MKKRNLFGWFAMAAMVIGTSCSSDEVVNDYSADNAIQFGTYLGRDVQGRGTELNNNNLENFGVFASYTGQTDWNTGYGFNFMYNQKVVKSVTGWEYSPIKYWPTTKNDMISFWAYAPYESSKSISVVGDKTYTSYPQIKYTLTADNLANAEDFTADVLMNEIRKGNGNSIDSQERNVSFTLQHELSRISFQAKLDRDAFTDGIVDAHQTFVNIKNITFGGEKFASEATYSFATEDNTRGTWSAPSTNATLDITGLLVKTDVAVGGYNKKGTRITNKNLVTLFGDDNYLFHIPTNGINGTSDEGDVTITITYDIVTIDGALNVGHSVTEAVKTFKLPKESLKQGSAYNYILTFGLNEIKLSASVADWDDNTVYDDVDWTLLN